MDFATLVRMLLRGWLAVLLCTVLGAAGGFAVTKFTPATYESSGLLYVTALGAEDATSLAQGTRFVQDQMKSYPTILTSPSILADVIAQRQLPDTPHQLSQRISSDIPLDTAIMRITVASQSAQEAQETATALIQRFVSAVNQLERRPGTQTSVIRLTLIDSPSVPSTPESPSLRINLLIGAAVGFLVGCIIAVALGLRRRSGRPDHQQA